MTARAQMLSAAGGVGVTKGSGQFALGGLALGPAVLAMGAGLAAQRGHHERIPGLGQMHDEFHGCLLK
jgi:hypothetical protein